MNMDSLCSGSLEDASWEILPSAGYTAEELTLSRKWFNHRCDLYLVNSGPEAVRVEEIVAFRFELHVSPDTPVYGEGYSKLSQYEGTLDGVTCITPLSDAGHYKLPQVDGVHTVYNLLLLSPGEEELLVGFSSCRRFSGSFRFAPGLLEVVLNCEGVAIPAGATVPLEEVMFLSGSHQADLLAQLGDRLQENHPPLPFEESPTGWCSWYAYGPSVTEEDIAENLGVIHERIPGLRYIQIDDGYQKHMGDWLLQHPNFPKPIRDLCHAIRDKGFEPAMWVAPFIAEQDSEVLRDHPEWFVQDENGNPLPSDRDSFGGWRFGPWYMLDGTHPGACEYLKHVFRTMREEWGCHYFKLDANMWGAMPFGQRYNPEATAVEAYRQGMVAVLEGAGEGCFLLGCNAPMWPSIGTVHGMRITGDISRKWKTMKVLSFETFLRNWQHRRLWINDPDCLVMLNRVQNIVGPDGKPAVSSSQITPEEFGFHLATILASGGMMLASDKMGDLTPEDIAKLQKLLPVSDAPAVFQDTTFRVGRSHRPDGDLLFALNETDEAIEVEVPVAEGMGLVDFWTDDAVETGDGEIMTVSLPPHSARVYLAV